MNKSDDFINRRYELGPIRKYIRPVVSKEKKEELKNFSNSLVINKRLEKLLKKQRKKFNRERQREIDSLQRWGSAKSSGKVIHRTDMVRSRNFYRSREWLALRFDVLLKYGRECMLCGIIAKPPHVDHIKPRSKYPELELDINNLQVLCHDCNMGKSNRDSTDLRPDSDENIPL